MKPLREVLEPTKGPVNSLPGESHTVLENFLSCQEEIKKRNDGKLKVRDVMGDLWSGRGKPFITHGYIPLASFRTEGIRHTSKKCWVPH